MSLFTNRDRTDLFRNSNALKEEYQPDEIVGREPVIEDLIDALWPVYRGDSPNNVLMFGPNGVGKTAVTHYVLEGSDGLLNDPEVPTDLTVEWFNCEEFSTGYGLGISIANRFLLDDEKLSPTGHSWGGEGNGKTVKHSLFNAIEDVGGTVLLVLDEIGTVDELDSLLYQMTRASGKGGQLDETRLGFIGVTTNGTFEEMLSPDTRSALKLRTIEVGSYGATQLRAVLDQRIPIAFHEGAIQDDVPPLVAAFGARNDGDARLTLDLMEQAGEIAEKASAEMVRETHVREAQTKIEKDHVMTVLGGLNTNAKFTVYALASEILDRGETGEPNPTTKEVYETYKGIIANTDGMDPRGQRQIRNYLIKCEQIGLLERNTVVRSDGKHKTHTLNFDVCEVSRVIQSEIERWDLRDRLDHQPYERVHALLD